jgi:hypothetical protein
MNMRFSIVLARRSVFLGAALALAGCASQPMHPVQTSEVDTVTGLTVISAGDIAIVGQLVSHSIMDLPEVAGASKPPLVRFAGVTSQINGPIDTGIYTALLRDRILLLTREKLRFVERQLPPLGSHKHHKGGGPLDVDTDADYKIAAQLRGNYGDDTYLVEVEFEDIHTGESLFTGSYRINREQEPSPTETPQPIGNPDIQQSGIESTEPNPPPDEAAPPPPQNVPGGNSGLQ